MRDILNDKEIAAPCYGYLALPADTYEEVLCERFGIMDWNRPEEDEKREKYQKQPFRALVKKLVDSEDAVVNPVKMLRDLKKLRAIGVFPVDIYARNYKNGLLVDFSIAETEPYWLTKLIRGEQLEVRRNSELFLFDEMIEAEGVKTSARAAPNTQYCMKLRSSAYSDDDEEDS